MVETHGNMKSFPSVNIVCQNEDCFGSMHVTYDEFSVDLKNLQLRVAECWNKRVNHAPTPP